MKFLSTSVLLISFTLIGCSSNDDDDNSNSISAIGDSVFVANTFQDIGITGGVQTVFGLSDSVVISNPDIELPNFIGFYNIDLSDNSITMELVDNSQAADLVLPAGRFDRYYVGFAGTSISTVSLDGVDELNEFANVSLIPAGFNLSVEDQFVTGIEMPVVYENGGILIELGEGTDLTELNRTLRVSFD